MKKILYCLIPLLVLAITTGNIQAQNVNSPTQEESKPKRSKKDREKPERTMMVKRSVPTDRKKKTTGNWISFAEAFDESGNKGSSENNPIEINTAGHLAYLVKQVSTGKTYAGKHFRLMADINLATHEWAPIGQYGDTEEDKSNYFCGLFHGNGHKIENMTITKGWDYEGLFGVCGAGSLIEQLGVVNCYVRGSLVIGGLVGLLAEGTISECYVAGDVAGANECVGGLAGINNGTITKSYASVSVYGHSNDVGGLTGVNGDRMMGVISDCYSTGKVIGYYNVGGLVGRNNNIISNCNASGNVSGEEWVGGLVGWTDNGEITNCHATGTVMGYFDVGGLVGFNGYQRSTVQINNSYAIGEVTGNGLGNYCIGGLAGYSGGRISNCFAANKVNGEESVGGLVGEHGGKIINSHAVGDVIGSFDVGGLIGFNGYPGTSTVVESSYATGSVTGYEVFNYSIGGLVGYCGGTVVNCFAEGSVSGGESVGGLVGEHGGTLVNSYATGAVDAKMTAGGLVGWNWSKLNACYAVGKVDSRGEAGGLIGRNNDSEAIITTCYFDEQNSGLKSGIGVDNNNQNSNVIPKITEELTGKLPEGFDSKTWEAVSGSYPKLKSVQQTKSNN